MATFKGCLWLSAILLTSTLTARTLAHEQGHPEPGTARNGDHPAGLARKFSVMAGLSQWLLFRGGNLALEYKTSRLALEISHGQGLDLNQVGGFAMSSSERDSGTRVRVPWTTGFGVGYRITENFHLLLEFKAHHFEVRASEGAKVVNYTTFSIGPGAFYSIYLTKGLFLQPNVRFWPNVHSTLDEGRVMIERCDGSSYEHRAHDFGFFGNVNLGYSF